MHADDDAPPPENEPAWQSPFGALSEVVEQYLPAVQDVHADDDAPPPEKEPAWQSPLTAASPPAHHLPAVQLSQAALEVLAVEGLKVPGLQGVQADDDAPPVE